MARRFLPVDRTTPALLPQNMYDWVPPSHVVRLVIDVVDQLDLTGLIARPGRSVKGRPGYHPRMLLTLLIYALACGLRSARVIEARCRVDASFRLVCGGPVPDHSTISRFRRAFGLAEGAIEELFTQVLVVCAMAGLGRLDYVAADGTKIGANAARDANRTEEGCRALAQQLLAEAEQADTAEAGSRPVLGGMDLIGAAQLSGPWASAPSRAERIARCLADLAAERQAEQTAREQAAQQYLDAAADGRPPTGRIPAAAAVAAAELALQQAIEQKLARDADYARRLAAALARGEAGPPGRKPLPVEQDRRVRAVRARLDRAHRAAAAATAAEQAQPDPTAGTPTTPRRNLTDPDSRLMRTATGGSIQGYNGQLSSTDDRLILDCHVTNAANDIEQATRLMAGAHTGAATLAAAHTHPDHDPHACHHTLCRHPDRDHPDHDPLACHTRLTTGIGQMLFDAGFHSRANLTAPGPDRLIAPGKHHDLDQSAHTHPTHGPPPADADPIQANTHRLRTPEGRAAYKRRAPTIEGVNAHLKHLGLSRFHLRGLPLVNFELKLASLTHNLLLLHRHQPAST